MKHQRPKGRIRPFKEKQERLILLLSLLPKEHLVVPHHQEDSLERLEDLCLMSLHMQRLWQLQVVRQYILALLVAHPCKGELQVDLPISTNQPTIWTNPSIMEDHLNMAPSISKMLSTTKQRCIPQTVWLTAF